MNLSHLYRLAQLDYEPSLVRVRSTHFRELAFDPKAAAKLQSMTPPEAVAASLVGAVQFALVANVINFQFWDVRYSGLSPYPALERYAFEGVTGALGMQRALQKAWGSKPTVSEFVSAFRHHDMEELFGAIPKAYERRRMLEELLADNPDGGSRRLDKATAVLCERVQQGRLDVSDASLLAVLFPQAYGGDPYLKRAQLALQFIAQYARHQKHEVTLDVTLFADYQVPRVARALGLLEYSEEMAQLVDGGALLQSGGKHERAIRAATVLLGRGLVEEAYKAYKVRLEAAAFDQWLWLQRNACGDSQFHLTETTNY